MCYRLYAAIHPGEDASYDNATQGIFSFLELWIGVIVACMPTMAPIFVNYILPIATTIHSKLFGSGSSGSGGSGGGRRGLHAAAVDDPAVNTFHREGPDAARNKKRRLHEKYPSLDDSALNVSMYERDDAYARGDSGELQLVSPRSHAHLQTDCAMAQDGTPQSRDGIYVQQGFHTQWNNV